MKAIRRHVPLAQWKTSLLERAGGGKMAPVQPHSHPPRKRRRSLRQNPHLLFVGFLTIVVLLFVAALIWLMSRPRFLNP